MKLNQAKSGMVKLPQLMINVPLKVGAKPLDSQEVKAVVSNVETKLDGRGRVLLRASGTEPLIRVMVEGEEAAMVSQFAQEIADSVAAAH